MKNSENKYNFDPSILKALINQGSDFLMELFRLAMSEAKKVVLISNKAERGTP